MCWWLGAGLVTLFWLYSITYFRPVERAVGVRLPELSARNGAGAFALFWAEVETDAELKDRYRRLQGVDTVAGAALAAGLGLLSVALLRQHAISQASWPVIAVAVGLAAADGAENRLLRRAVDAGRDCSARRAATLCKFLLAALLAGTVVGGLLWLLPALLGNALRHL